MDPWRDVERSIREASGAAFAVESRSSIGGGCINECFRLHGGSRDYFVKVNVAANADMFSAEAAGLEEIAGSRTVRVPWPLCHGANATASWLVLEYLDLRAGTDGSVRELGRKLAGMHRVTAPRHGWKRNNTIGATLQVNTPSADWIQFWREQRLGFQLRLAGSKGHGGRLAADGNRL